MAFAENEGMSDSRRPSEVEKPTQAKESAEAKAPPATRLVWIDVLRTVSIFAVILLHAAAPLLLEYDTGAEQGGRTWWIGNLYDAAVRWCVPVFVMVSGALLLGRSGQESVGTFLRRRMLRVALPFLAWSVLYFEWGSRFYGGEPDYSEFLPTFLAEPIAYHLWFLYMLLGLYLLAPMLGALFTGARRRLGVYAVTLWALWAGVLPMAERLLGVETWYTPERANTPLMLVGYFLLGYLLRDLDYSLLWRVLAPVALVASVAATAWGTFQLTSASGGEFQPLFYEYYSLNVMLMSIAIFVTVASCQSLRGVPVDAWRTRFWRFVSLPAFGVYLLHVMVLDLLRRGVWGVQLDLDSFDPLLSVPLLALTVFIASLLPVLVLERIPLVRRILV